MMAYRVNYGALLFCAHVLECSCVQVFSCGMQGGPDKLLEHTNTLTLYYQKHTGLVKRAYGIYQIPVRSLQQHHSLHRHVISCLDAVDIDAGA
jgi:hypothetical protein